MFFSYRLLCKMKTFSYHMSDHMSDHVYLKAKGLHGRGLLFGSKVALNPGLGGVRDGASANISHEQTQSNRVTLSTLNATFPNDFFFRLFRDRNSCRCATCGGPTLGLHIYVKYRLL